MSVVDPLLPIPPGPDEVEELLARVILTASDASLRRFSLACVRRVRHTLQEAFCQAIDVAERHLAGLATDEDLAAAVRAVKRASGRRRDKEWAVYHAVRYVPGSPQRTVVEVANLCAAIARDTIPLPERPWGGVQSVTGFALFWSGGGPDTRSVVGSSATPFPADAPPEAVAAFQQAMNELRATEAAATETARREEAAREAAFAKSVEATHIARRQAYFAERAAQLLLLREQFPSPS